VTTYTHGHQEAVLRSHRSRTVANSAGYLAPHLRPGMRVLDVGCGPATITADLVTTCGVSVVGIDPSASVIEEARRDFPSLDLRVGDVFTETGSYDVVHAHQVLQHLSDPVGALRAMGALAPGGIVAARDSDYTWFEWSVPSDALDRWLEVYLAVCRRNGAHPDAGRHLLRWAHEAGFADVTYTVTSWVFATPESRAWWCGLWADRCTSTSFAEQAVAYGIATPAELEELAAGWRAWADHDDAVFVVPSGEILCRT